MSVAYNNRNPAVKRLMKEAQELSEPTELYSARPLEDNLFEWHFTIRGPVDSDFHGGIYHGRIIIPSEYPMKPPNIVLLTPNGRFETHRKICLSISEHHPESWRPSWSIRTALLAIIGFMPTHGVGAIGSLDLPKEERQMFAKKSQSYTCSVCGAIRDLLLPLTDASKSMKDEVNQAASQISINAEVDSTKQTKSNEVTMDKSSVDSTQDTTNIKSSSSSSSGLSPSVHAPSVGTSSTTPVNSTDNTPLFSDMNPWLTLKSPTNNNDGNSGPKIAYWLCFPVYCPDSSWSINPQVPSSIPVPSTSSSTTNDPNVPLGFAEWVKLVKNERDTSGAQSRKEPPSAPPLDTLRSDRPQATNSRTYSSKNELRHVDQSSSPQLNETAMERITVPAEGKTSIDQPVHHTLNDTKLNNTTEANENTTDNISKTKGAEPPVSGNESERNQEDTSIPNTSILDTDHPLDELRLRTTAVSHNIAAPSQSTTNQNLPDLNTATTYRAANICAVGVAVALFMIVLRRLALMMQGI